MKIMRVVVEVKFNLSDYIIIVCFTLEILSCFLDVGISYRTRTIGNIIIEYTINLFVFCNSSYFRNLFNITKGRG